jgi:DNA-binding NarL/FixJ family response regulator
MDKMLDNLFLISMLTCALSGLALGAFVWLFLSKNHDSRLLRRQLSETRACSDKLAELAQQVEQQRSRLEEIEQRPNPAVNWSSEAPSVNLNRRGQVLRLYRRGDQTSEIASTLGMSEGEVKLIVKVHELARETQPEKVSRNVL